MKLKKSQLIEKLVEDISDETEENSRKKFDLARDTVNLFFNSIKSAVISGDRVEIRGFGSFAIREYDQYTGRNPKTGEKVQVNSKKLPVFRPGRELRDKVNAKD